MPEQQTDFQEANDKQNYQNSFAQLNKKKLDQKNNLISHKGFYFFKKVFLFSIILIFLVSIILLFYKVKHPEKYANLFISFKIVNQNNLSSYEAFQRDKSINRDAKGEAGALMKSVVDKIFTCSGFTIETKSSSKSSDKEGNVGVTVDIVTKGDILPSSCDGHYFVTGITGENIIIDEVTTDTPAEKAGMKKGDQIVAVDGVNLNNRDDLVNYIQSKENLPVSLLVRRDEKKIVLPIIPEKLYGERIGIGIKFVETNYRWSSESIYYDNNVYDKYSDSAYLLGTGDVDDFDNPSLNEGLQWSNPMHYLNYLRFYKNPKIIENTKSQVKIAFNVDIDHFKPVDMNYFGKGSGMYNEIIEIEGEITIDRYSKNPIQEELTIITNFQTSSKLHRETENIILNISNFDKGVVITPPDKESIIIGW